MSLEQTSIFTTSTSAFSEVVKELSVFTKTHQSNNIIVDLLSASALSLDNLLLLLPLSNKHKGSKKSFVIVNAATSIDIVPEELMLVPTMQEAEDVISMEAIERDLGF